MTTKKIMSWPALKIKPLALSCFLLAYLTSVSQHKPGFNCDSILKKHHAEIKQAEGIKFLVFKKDNTPKPTILFITGSEFVPFFVNDWFVYNFDINLFIQKFNLVIVSKPGIPIQDDSLKNPYLNQSYLNNYYSDSTDNVPEKFIKNNNRVYYVACHNTIISYLSKQTWVDKTNMFIISHSQGTHIATSIALQNKLIKKVVLISPGSIYNRFYESIRKVRIDETYGKISSQNAQHSIDSISNQYERLKKNKLNNVDLFDGGTYFSYYSFTSPTLTENLIQIIQPTLLIYGTASAQDLDCDYLKLELIKANKTNVQVNAKINYDHSLFKSEFNDKGEVINQVYDGNTIYLEVLNWLTKN